MDEDANDFYTPNAKIVMLSQLETKHHLDPMYNKNVS